MSWGSHPDTLTIAISQGRANSTGCKSGSLEWTKEYRRAYAEHGCKCCRGFEKYLTSLDERIKELEKYNENI